MTDDLEYQLIDAREERRRIEWLRNARRRELEAEARVYIDARLAEEFPQLAKAVQVEAACQKAVEDADIETGKEKLNRLSNYGVLVEWDVLKRNWYNLEKRYWHYPTGRRAVVEMCTHETQFADNCPDYRKPLRGELFLRRVKKNGEKSLQILTRLRDGGLPNNWLPEGERPGNAAPEE